MAEKKIILGLTTTPGSNWREKIKEIDKFDIKEIVIFPVALNKNEREEMYKLLEESSLEKIPAAHLRDDMKETELDYLKKIFGTEIFNTHTKREPHSIEKNKVQKYINNIFIENGDLPPDPGELKGWGGICIDFSHWMDGKLKNIEDYDSKMKASLKKFQVGFAHISAIGNKLNRGSDLEFSNIIYENYHKHFLESLKEIDYIANFKNFIPEISAIELENSFEEQLEIKQYIEKIIK